MAKDLIIFDMDGVLVEVTESYRAAIQATVKHFTGYEPPNAEIQDWKNRGGFNDDWILSLKMVKARGVSVAYVEIVEHFQSIFLGNNNDGLILKEQWMAADGLFEMLHAKYQLAVFTGRLHDEAMLTIDRFYPGLFPTVIGSDEVSKTKPDPEGIFTIRKLLEHDRAWYIGDTVDDARAAAAAGVPFIGIASPSNPKHKENAALLETEGAIAVLDDINALEAVLV